MVPGPQCLPRGLWAQAPVGLWLCSPHLWHVQPLNVVLPCCSPPGAPAAGVRLGAGVCPVRPVLLPMADDLRANSGSSPSVWAWCTIRVSPREARVLETSMSSASCHRSASCCCPHTGLRAAVAARACPPAAWTQGCRFLHRAASVLPTPPALSAAGTLSQAGWWCPCSPWRVPVAFSSDPGSIALWGLGR